MRERCGKDARKIQERCGKDAGKMREMGKEMGKGNCEGRVS